MKIANDVSKMAREEIGRKQDNNKQRWDLLPLQPINEIVKVLTFGAKKYSDNNWQQVSNAKERYYAALMRHIVAWREGEWLDDESKLPHLAHAGCCLIFLMWLGLKK